MSGVIDHDSVGALFTIDNMEKKTTKTRKIQEMRPQHGYHTKQLQLARGPNDAEPQQHNSMETKGAGRTAETVRS